MRTPRLVGGIAQRFEGAVGALRVARDAYLAAVVDELVGEGDPVVLRDDLHEVLLDLFGRRILRELEAA